MLNSCTHSGLVFCLICGRKMALDVTISNSTVVKIVFLSPEGALLRHVCNIHILPSPGLLFHSSSLSPSLFKKLFIEFRCQKIITIGLI